MLDFRIAIVNWRAVDHTKCGPSQMVYGQVSTWEQAKIWSGFGWVRFAIPIVTRAPARDYNLAKVFQPI